MENQNNAKIAKQEANKKVDIEKSFIEIVLERSSVEHIYDLISAEVDRQASNPKELLRLANTCKDIQFNELTGDIMKHIRDNHAEWWREEQAGAHTDMSSADGGDNR